MHFTGRADIEVTRKAALATAWDKAHSYAEFVSAMDRYADCQQTLKELHRE
jgi:hypothetical protein